MAQAIRAAVFGLGSMGGGMARSLLRAGMAVTGFDPATAAVAAFVTDGGTGADNARAAAAGADIAVSVVVNAAQTEALLFGPEGIADLLPEGAVFVSCATMDPDVARGLATRRCRPRRDRGPHGARLRFARRLRKGAPGARCHGGQGL